MNTEKSVAKNPYLLVMLVAGIMLLLLIGYFTLTGTGNTKTDYKPTNTGITNTENKSESAVEIPKEVASFSNPEAAAKAIKNLTRHDTNDPLAKGKLDAPVTMLQFIDYSCPMCIKFETETAPKLEKYVQDGSLRVEVHNYPIFADKYSSDLAAAGGIAAGKQGKFWEYLTAAANLGLVEGHINWNEAKVLQMAKIAGITNLDKFKQDMESKDTKTQIDQDIIAAQQFGISGTPAFLLNNRIVPGALPYDIFAQAIEAMKNGAK